MSTGSVALEIGIAGIEADEAEQELRSLVDWLRADDDVRRHAAITLEAGEPGSGAMGAALEVIKRVLDSGFSLGNLALAYAGWRATRTTRDEPGFELIVRNGKTKITINAAEAQEAEKQLRALVRD